MKLSLFYSCFDFSVASVMEDTSSLLSMEMSYKSIQRLHLKILETWKVTTERYVFICLLSLKSFPQKSSNLRSKNERYGQHSYVDKCYLSKVFIEILLITRSNVWLCWPLNPFYIFEFVLLIETNIILSKILPDNLPQEYCLLPMSSEYNSSVRQAM